MMHTLLLVLVILEAVSPLLAFEVICEPKYLEKPVGYNTSLRCFCKCERKCAVERIIWEKDDNILQLHPPLKNQNNQTTNSRFQFMYCNIENGNISVDIENLQNSDAGTYKCTIIIDGAYGQGTINLNVSDPDEKHTRDVTEQTDPNQKFKINSKNPAKRYDPVTPNKKQKINSLALGLGVAGGAAALVCVITVLSFVLWKKRLGCSHFQKKKKLPYTGDGEESKSSTGSDSSESELIKKPLNHDGTEKSVNLATTQPLFWSQSQAWKNGEGWCQEKHLAV